MKKRNKIAKTITLLLALGLYILRFSPVSYDILRHSSQEGYYSIVAIQLALGVKPDGPARTALIESIYNNHPAIAELLVHHGANIERQWMSGEPNGPPLAWALMYGDIEIAKMLLRNGASANYKPIAGPNNALHMAVELGDADLVRLLLRKGADPNATPLGPAPLHLAVASGNMRVARLLIEAGASKDVKAKGTLQPYGYCSVLRIKSEPDIRPGATPLDLATARGDKLMIKLLSTR